MQLWNFVFLAQSWETDRGPMGKNLSTLGWRAKKQDKSLALLVYPEGESNVRKGDGTSNTDDVWTQELSSLR